MQNQQAFPLVDVNLSVVLLLFEDAIVIKKNFLYHNVGDKENFIISINSNMENMPQWQIILILSGIFIVISCICSCLKEACCFCIRRCMESNTRLSQNEDRNDNGDSEIEQFRNGMHEVWNGLLEEYAAYQRRSEEQRSNALRNLQRRHPLKEYSEDHKLDIDVCAICFEEFKKGEKTRELSCHHEYHADCIDDCLVRVSRRDTCPLCNSEVNMANSLVDATESTRLLTSNYGLYSSSTSSNGSEPSEVPNGNEPSEITNVNPSHSTDESGELLATAEGSVNYVESESDNVQLV